MQQFPLFFCSLKIRNVFRTIFILQKEGRKTKRQEITTSNESYSIQPDSASKLPQQLADNHRYITIEMCAFYKQTKYFHYFCIQIKLIFNVIVISFTGEKKMKRF